MADLKPEAFAEIIKLCSDLKRIGAAQLTEMRATRILLAGIFRDDISADAKKANAKAEGETTDAIAAAASGSTGDAFMNAVENIVKEQMASGMGVPGMAALMAGGDQAAIEAALRSQLVNGSAKPPEQPNK